MNSTFKTTVYMCSTECLLKVQENFQENCQVKYFFQSACEKVI